MVSRQEKQARIQEFFRFSKEEVFGLLAAVIIAAFIFSFRDWVVEFNAATGIRNWIVMSFIIAVTLAVRLSIQKISGLTEGYKGEFKVWWSGLATALIIAFISVGRIPLVLIGTMANSMMTKQRLGEFRYGFSHAGYAAIAALGVIVNLALATVSAVGLYFLPNNYLFGKGLIFNLVMAICSLIPIKQLDGLAIFFGNRKAYFYLLGGVLIYWILLLSKTRMGLILAVAMITLTAIVLMLKTSEK